jgi:hypothetical protein
MGLAVADTAGLANHHRGQLHPHREPSKERVSYPSDPTTCHDSVDGMQILIRQLIFSIGFAVLAVAVAEFALWAFYQ